jgi:phage shock protein PspC (stress-responsive transcriptional regulator)
MMENVQPSLFTRDDTFFGVCQGLGEDLGIKPDLLRVGLTLFLFFQPLLAIGTYLAAGAVVFASRWLFPVARLARATGDQTAGQVAAAHVQAETEVTESEALAQAA